jgi:hypothetical protein
MECFSHAGSPAVGVCKTCGKATCRSCAKDAGLFMTCSEVCEKEAADVHEMNQRGKKLYGIGVPKRIASGVIMWFLFALLFGGFGVFQTIKKQQPEWFLLLFGAVAFCIGILAYKRTKESGLQC